MRLCVFCGSSAGNDPVYMQQAARLGEALARAGIGLVYGGASVGLMGAVADAVLAHGGEVIGVIPQALEQKEIAHPGLTELRVVASMHERKALMAELADGFIAMPGGVGTLEELFEVWTWAQLGYHEKPCALFNVHGFYDGLSAFLAHVVNQGFLKEVYQNMVLVEDDVQRLLQAIGTYQPPKVVKWVRQQEQT